MGRGNLEHSSMVGADALGERAEGEKSDNESFYENGEEQGFVVPDSSAEELRYASKLFGGDDLATIGTETGQADAGSRFGESGQTIRECGEEEQCYCVDGEESGEKSSQMTTTEN